MFLHRGPPAIPRDYLQAYFEYARTVSEGAADSGRALLARLVTERTAERDRGVSERDGFSDAVEQFLLGHGWKCVQAHDGGAFGLDFAIEDPRGGSSLSTLGLKAAARPA